MFRSIFSIVLLIGFCFTARADEVSELTKKSQEAARELERASARAKAKLETSAEYRLAVVERDHAEHALDEARRNGTPEDRLAASSAFNRARGVVDKMRDDALAKNPEVAGARKRQQEALDALSQAAARSRERKIVDAEIAEARQTVAQLQADEKAGVYHVGEWARRGDVQMRVTSTKIGQLTLHQPGGGFATTNTPYLIVTVEIANTSQTHKVDYQSFAHQFADFGRDHATATDEFSNAYKGVWFGLYTPDGQINSESIHPGKSVEDVVIFEVPIDRAKTINLNFPAGNFGGEGIIRVRANRPE